MVTVTSFHRHMLYHGKRPQAKPATLTSVPLTAAVLSLPLMPLMLSPSPLHCRLWTPSGSYAAIVAAIAYFPVAPPCHRWYHPVATVIAAACRRRQHQAKHTPPLSLPLLQVATRRTSTILHYLQSTEKGWSPSSTRWYVWQQANKRMGRATSGWWRRRSSAKGSPPRWSSCCYTPCATRPFWGTIQKSLRCTSLQLPLATSATSTPQLTRSPQRNMMTHTLFTTGESSFSMPPSPALSWSWGSTVSTPPFPISPAAPLVRCCVPPQLRCNRCIIALRHCLTRE